MVIVLQIDSLTKTTIKMRSNIEDGWSRTKSGLSISTALDEITKKDSNVAQKVLILT